MGWHKEQLDEEISYEEFLAELEHLKAWISRSRRTRRSWLFSVESWARGDH